MSESTRKQEVDVKIDHRINCYPAAGMHRNGCMQAADVWLVCLLCMHVVVCKSHCLLVFSSFHLELK